MTRINLIGGQAYSTVGGIQAVNRFVIDEAVQLGALRRAFLLWDDPTQIVADAIAERPPGCATLYALRRRAFVGDILWHGRRHPRDHWLCTHVNYALLALFAAGWRRRRVSLLAYAAELDTDFTALKRLALRRVGEIVAISDYTKQKLVAIGADPARVRVMYLGTRDPCPDWRPAPPATTASTVLFVGRMDERYKGQLELLDAMLLLKSRLPDLRMAFVGGGRILPEWRKEASQRGLDDVVTFTGRISDQELARAYAQATVFAMPSENEGFGLVYAEAMAHGVPCIGSERDAAREVIRHGETGYCVPTGNSTALADAIATLVRSPELRDRMGSAARARFVAEFAAARYRERVRAMLCRWTDAS